MHPNFPDSYDIPKANGGPHPNDLSLEALFSAAEEGKLELYHHDELTPLGRMYYGDKCERPGDQW
ncbi:MAG: hypothetical protein CVV47_16380 [Spirochaetae bacterium HGW-Spirochaetae-3]|jgi:hypothetical protein|nr:MAG: hypothetical protein CVV47_16380 [Spirochaetae bacterium HGW-Spirochaetae-3]